ncbi:thioredoxin-dependent thiol peroxidase [Spirochaetia bacterium 38H-sp]|uniref:thioredoxin-dependent peroxiredoxin n=1 Tax=Rarispira pelagica TaxID=3141764 RepID=A0ABU9U8V1_9SPIR
MLNIGDSAPDFCLVDDNGVHRRLSDFEGKKKVIYFYPRDNTPGCTTEACSFRDNYETILATGAVVIGISGDSVKSHANFKTKYDLPFYLLSDPNKEVIKAYQAWGKKKMYGREYEGIMRCTYITDENNRIIAVFPKVKPSSHVKEILDFLSNK